MLDSSQKILSEVVIFQKYAKHLPEKHRRETWKEICDRNREMHIRKYPALKEEINSVYTNFVETKKVLPSMRSMQFGGRPIELSNNRLFNCAFSNADNPAVFWETMFNLLSGSGCFKGDTLIKTKNGDKKIADITLDDEILTYIEETDMFSYVKPDWSGKTNSRHKRKIKITSNDGTIINCTSDHKFLTKNRGWVEAETLTHEDEIISHV